MDSLITAAARALGSGDPLGALNLVALREDSAALALRGVAMAQLGDFERAKALLKRAGRGFGAKEAVARARCLLAEAEIALASRDLGWPQKALAAARTTLELRGDAANAAHARLLEIRRLLLFGRLDEAERAFAELDAAPLPAALKAAHQLAVAGVAMRRIRTESAHAALLRAEAAALEAGIPALAAEVLRARRELDTPVARLVGRQDERPLLLREVETFIASGALIIDACRNLVRAGATAVPLARRPVLFGLARALGEAWPHDADRASLLRRAFGARFTDESHRARLRVEIGRLRAALKPIAAIHATKRGFVLVPEGNREVVTLAQPSEEPYGDVLALLADGEAWSSSALSLALGASQRNVQRALLDLAERGQIEALGRARARRWTAAPPPGFTTTLLLPAPLAGG